MAGRLFGKVGRSGGGRTVVEIDPHAHGADRLDPVRLLRLYDARTVAGETPHLRRVEDVELQFAHENANNAPCAGFGSMLPPQRYRQHVLVEDRRRAIRQDKRSGGKGCAVTCRFPWSPTNIKKTI